MKKKLLTIFVLGPLICSCFLIPWLFKLSPKFKKPFVESVFISHFTSSKLPCLTIEIEDKKFIVMLDLGFEAGVSLAEERLKEITEKSFLKTRTMWGFEKNKYQTSVYKIPKICIQGVRFNPVYLQEEDKFFAESCRIAKDKEETLVPVLGKIGWEIFNKSALYLNLGECEIAICDSKETFQAKEFSLNHFIKVPFKVDNGLIEFDTMTPQGPLRCILDSGCTANLLNKENPENLPLEEIIEDENNFVTFTRFEIGEKDFGAMRFDSVPKKLPDPFEAILGMDFLFKHRVFIDFKNREIYFSVPEKKEESFFVPLKISKFTSSNLPCLKVEIEGKKMTSLFDLGFTNDLGFTRKLKIRNKSLIGSRSVWGIRGNERKANIYTIPKIKLDDLTLKHPNFEKENKSKKDRVSVGPGKDDPPLPIRIGWKLFKEMTLYLDLGNSAVAVCDSIETFQKQGYSLENFSQAPLLLDRNLIEFEAMTPDGPLLCYLNTNATANFMNVDNPENEPLEKMIVDESRFKKMASFKIGEKDFGMTTFRPLPIKLPIQIGAILGMEFLTKHKVFIDFKNRQIYFND